MTEAAVTSSRALERAVGLEAVRRASLLCRSVRASFAAADRTDKADRSPVTVADLGAQALIGLALADALPHDPVMGEEDSGPLRDSPALSAAVLERVREDRPDLSEAELWAALDGCGDEGGPARRWWTLDPVDGTKGFLRDEQYAVALALVEDGEVVLGVLGCPNLPAAGLETSLGEVGATETDVEPDPAARGCLFVAERGLGAWQLPLRADGPADPSSARRIHVADVADASEARYAESVESAHSSQGDAARIGARLGITLPPLRLDSQAKYGIVARGDASIYLRLPHGDYRENVWDHAAGSIIVREAGGIVSDILGQPLDLTAGRRFTRNRGVVATAASIHEQVIQAVRATLGA